MFSVQRFIIYRICTDNLNGNENLSFENIIGVAGVSVIVLQTQGWTPQERASGRLISGTHRCLTGILVVISGKEDVPGSVSKHLTPPLDGVAKRIRAEELHSILTRCPLASDKHIICVGPVDHQSGLVVTRHLAE